MRSLWASFRVRLLVGTLLWTVGLLYIVHLLSVLLLIGPASLERMHRGGWRLALSLALIVAGAAIVRRAIASFAELRRRLADVRRGHDRQIAGRYPTEVQPLVDDLNALLEHRDRRVREALSKAGDLAHGLKTPLAVMAQEAERAAAAGESERAAVIGAQVERMRRHIGYHLAHARAAASGALPGTRTALGESAAGLARTLARLHADRGLHIDVAVPATHGVRGQREDVDEMLGNLLDNACRWARTTVRVASAECGDRVVITVDDDGPGLPASMREAVLLRGVRGEQHDQTRPADQAGPGSGFGLAIVRDLAALHGGAIALESSPLGGLRARLELANGNVPLVPSSTAGAAAR